MGGIEVSKVIYCPYYEGEREKYVACEDGRRHFKYPDDTKYKVNDKGVITVICERRQTDEQ